MKKNNEAQEDDRITSWLVLSGALEHRDFLRLDGKRVKTAILRGCRYDVLSRCLLENRLTFDQRS